MRRFYPDDIINLALWYLDKKKIPKDETFLHITLYEFKNKYEKEFPELFKEFYFKESGTFPYSPLLNRVIRRGRMASIIESIDKDNYIIERNSKFMEKFEKNFNEEELKIIRELSETFNVNVS